MYFLSINWVPTQKLSNALGQITITTTTNTSENAKLLDKVAPRINLITGYFLTTQFKLIPIDTFYQIFGHKKSSGYQSQLLLPRREIISYLLNIFSEAEYFSNLAIELSPSSGLSQAL